MPARPALQLPLRQAELADSNTRVTPLPLLRRQWAPQFLNLVLQTPEAIQGLEHHLGGPHLLGDVGAQGLDLASAAGPTVHLEA